MADKIKVTLEQINLIMAGVLHGHAECQRGKDLAATLNSVFDSYIVVPDFEPGDICDRCGIMKRPEGGHLCEDCGEDV